VIFNASKTEGNSGTTTLSFVVTLSTAPALAPVTVQYATANGTAVAPGDYLATSGTVTFPVGSSSATVNVTIVGDQLKEKNETFVVKLSNPSANAYLGDTQATGTIVNDD
jgi:hypothetical protein